jgi:hypothetical protein
VVKKSVQKDGTKIVLQSRAEYANVPQSHCAKHAPPAHAALTVRNVL